MSPQKQHHRLLAAMILVPTAVVVILDFFVFEITQGIAMSSILLSMACTLFACLLSFYAIGFTTLRMSALAMAVLAVNLSVWTYSTPSRARFALSKSQFETLKTELESGGTVETPRWVGLFHVKKLKQTRRGQIHYWTAQHPYGNTGVVYAPGGKGPSVNIMFAKEISKHWFYVCVD